MAYKNDRRDDRREDRRGNRFERGNDRKFAHPFIEDGDWGGDRGGDRGFGDRDRRENRFERGNDRGFGRGGDRRGFGERRDNRFGRDNDRGSDRGGDRNFGDRNFGDRRERNFGDRERRFERNDRGFDRGGDRNFGDRRERNFGDRERRFERNDRGFDRGGDRNFGDRRERSFGDRERRFERNDRGFDRGGDRRGFGDRDRRFGRGNDRFSRDGERGYSRDFRRDKPARNMELDYNSERHQQNAQKKEEGYVRLNRYIANAGVCSRREADEMIANGVIKVNGEICTVLGTLVGPGDKVQFGDQTLKAEKKVYLLMNKPKGYITTADDPEDRKTVMELLDGACKERIYPVGRLDRNTTGVLLFTNDGEMAKRLTHPSHGARKIYQVTLDHPLAKSDMQSIASGVNLEDGFVAVDEIDYVQEGSRSEVGVVIHSGKNRIVRRIFEHFGYEVVKLDRVLFAELTKKGLERGQWRFLTEKEVSFLQMNTGAEEGKTPRAAKARGGRKAPVFTEEQIAEAEAIERAEAEIIKPKRGRKKKEEEVVVEVEEKPKRGRKKKEEEVVVEVEEKPKRGRKKKEEVVVEVEEKPKRGRKKKEEAVVEVEEKPKRGRKKKEETVVEVEEKPKRGRKKKEEAVVEVEEKPKRGRKKKEETVVEEKPKRGRKKNA